MEAIKRKIRPDTSEIFYEGVIGGFGAALIGIIAGILGGFPFPGRIIAAYSGDLPRFFAVIISFFLGLFNLILRAMPIIIPALLVALAMAALYAILTRSMATATARRVMWLVALVVILVLIVTPFSPFQWQPTSTGGWIVLQLMHIAAVTLPTLSTTTNA